MYFREIAKDRYRVHKDKDDKKFYGIVEKHEYVSIDMSSGRRVTKRFWKANGATGGWKHASKKQFTTREAAGEFLLKDAAVPYADRETHWNKRQGVSAVLKEIKVRV